ncbi:MAG TPA: hypothetical protein VEU30_01305 [Thermoanaerobaculia bacterium]|nr:hypothetical protein [Thermoanaerobaculia bacterium]
MRRTAALLLLLAACAPTRVPPASTPPPPPVRPNNAAVLEGSVFDSAGQPVPHPRIDAWTAGPSCKPEGPLTRVWGGASSSYQLTLERGAGPAERGCVVVDVTAGGAKTRKTFPVTFTNPAKPLTADLTLPPPARLTREEADRIIEVVRRGITSRDRDAIDELATYLGTGPEATSARLGEIQRRMRTVTAVNFVDEFTYDLTGHREPALRVRIRQDSMTRVEF